MWTTIRLPFIGDGMVVRLIDHFHSSSYLVVRLHITCFHVVQRIRTMFRTGVPIPMVPPEYGTNEILLVPHRMIVLRIPDAGLISPVMALPGQRHGPYGSLGQFLGRSPNLILMMIIIIFLLVVVVGTTTEMTQHQISRRP